MIRVVGDRVLVALPPRVDETVSAGGIVLVKDPDRFYTPSQGIVMAVGQKDGTVSLDDVLALLDVAPSAPYSTGDADIEAPPLRVALEALRPAAFDVAEGDCVIFPRSAGEEIHDNGIDYVILREADIIGIVEPLQKEPSA